MEDFNCSPSTSIFQTCTKLITSNFKRIFYWFFGIFGFFGNFLLISIMIYQLKKKNIFQLQILFSDFIVSSYLLSIALTDVYFDKNYIENDVKWRKSTFCQLLGTFITLALILSATFTFFVTIERFIIVVYPFKQNILAIFKKWCILFTYLFSISISCIPFLIKNVSEYNFFFFFFLFI